jgi:curved DNA-binding protein CbpA
MLLNPYKILDILRDASDVEIKKAYFKKIREFPPEKDPEKFKEIRAAYEQIRSSASRAEADLFIVKEVEIKLPPKRALYVQPPDREQVLKMIKLLYGDHYRTVFTEDFRDILNEDS